MSETLLAAMKKSKSPEEFVERFLLPALERRRIPSARTVFSKMAGRPPQKLNEFTDSLEKGGVHYITFVDESNPEKHCFFQIKKEYAAENGLVKKEGHRQPQATLGNAVFFHVGENDFTLAASKTGTRDFIPPKRDMVRASIFFPLKLFQREGWVEKVKASPGLLEKGNAEVSVNTKTFRKLENTINAWQFVYRYGHVLGYLRGLFDKRDLTRRANFDKEDLRKNNFDPYQTFLEEYKHRRRLLQELAGANSLDGVGELMRDHWGVQGQLAKEHSRRIWNILCHRDGRRAAVDLAQDTERERRQLKFERKPKRRR
ncbi:MAG: hypothetical protein HZB67_04550, partial [Candidatus Aenigmarchaeota archaeon]|nr:hypothetical protein [Candidatus Aenigmarchaeota archaeon]